MAILKYIDVVDWVGGGFSCKLYAHPNLLYAHFVQFFFPVHKKRGWECLEKHFCINFAQEWIFQYNDFFINYYLIIKNYKHYYKLFPIFKMLLRV